MWVVSLRLAMRMSCHLELICWFRVCGCFAGGTKYGGGGFQALLWYQENEMSIPFDADSDLNLGYMRAGR